MRLHRGCPALPGESLQRCRGGGASLRSSWAPTAVSCLPLYLHETEAPVHDWRSLLPWTGQGPQVAPKDCEEAPVVGLVVWGLPSAHFGQIFPTPTKLRA